MRLGDSMFDRGEIEQRQLGRRASHAHLRDIASLLWQWWGFSLEERAGIEDRRELHFLHGLLFLLFAHRLDLQSDGTLDLQLSVQFHQRARKR